MSPDTSGREATSTARADTAPNAPDVTRESNLARRRISEAAALAVETSRFIRRQVAALGHGLIARRADVSIAVGLAAMAALWAMFEFRQLDFPILIGNFDRWFDADVNRIVEANESIWASAHYRTKVHPLFALFVAFPFIVLRKLGLSSRDVSTLFVGVSTLAFVCAFYSAARTLGLRKLDASIATALMLSTGASMFWLVVPEAYALGAASLLLPLLWIGVQRGEHDTWSAALQSLITASITVTNWMAGLLAAVIALGVRSAIRIGVLTFALLSAFTLAQQAIFPKSGRLFDFGEEPTFLLANMGRVLSKSEPFWVRAVSFVGQPFLTPTPELVQGYNAWPGVGLVSAFPTEWSAATVAASVGWLVLLWLGIPMLRQRPQQEKVFILSTLALQIVLHSVYGHALFLYTLHFTPFVVLIASLSCLSRRRTAALTVMTLTAVASFVHNNAQLQTAIRLLGTIHVDAPTP